MIFSGNNSKEIIQRGAVVTESVKKTNAILNSNLFLANSSGNLLKNVSKIESSAEYQGEGGGMEGIMENWDLIQDINLVNIHTPDIALNKLRDNIVEYEVQNGDTISSIAQQFDISINTILWANNLSSRSLIKPGMKLRILPISGIEHTIKNRETLNSIALYYKADIDKIIEFNNLPADGKVVVGKSIIIPDGIKPINTSAIVLSPSRRTNFNTYNLDAPRVITTTADVGYFMYPTTGRNWGRLHGFNGVDIATPCGTPVFSAAEGTIITAASGGWNGGYGNYIKIRHPNGVITLYAHLLKVLVKSGSDVAKGQLIGVVGSTGRSTGCHLHWEVRGMSNPLVRY